MTQADGKANGIKLPGAPDRGAFWSASCANHAGRCLCTLANTGPVPRGFHAASRDWQPAAGKCGFGLRQCQPRLGRHAATLLCDLPATSEPAYAHPLTRSQAALRYMPTYPSNLFITPSLAIWNFICKQLAGSRVQYEADKRGPHLLIPA
jgi:hypothetical protein